MLGQMKKWSNILMKKLDKIEVDANKCQKVRAVVSSCSACMDVCPAGAITIGQDSLAINDGCMECGLCTNVCPTNALKWNDPPLMQIFQRIRRLAEKEADIYIACASSVKGKAMANVAEVPCLGMLPWEFWLAAGVYAPNLQIVFQPSTCRNCSFHGGEGLFLKEKQQAEEILGSRFSLRKAVSEAKADSQVDYSRRKLFITFWEEVKETNTITVKETLSAGKTLSPFEKYARHHEKEAGLKEMEETAEEIKNRMADKWLGGQVIHTDKRALLLRALEKKPELQERITLSVPEMKESCTRCDACAFLCPTDAIVIDGNSYILSTEKCVSSGLCGEICYEKHIHMKPASAAILRENYVFY